MTLPPAPLDRVSPEDFTGLWQRLGARSDPNPIHETICRAYREPQRRYHTLRHIAHALTLLDGVRPALDEPDAAELALWLHDVVYDPRASDSEAQSAAWARLLLDGAGVPPRIVTRVADLILATAHAGPPSDGDARTVVDIDLAILGAAAPDFDAYEEQIRAEYAWVAEPVFLARRAALLRAFLERPAIYLSPAFRHLEDRARANLLRSIARLQGARS